MLVILKKEVPNLGDAGEVVRVAPGYGRNYLIPRGLAILANESNQAELAHQKRVADVIRRKELTEAQAMGEKLEKLAITLRRQAGEDDKLFGSVTKRDIAAALADEGIEIDRRMIQLEEDIRSIGLFNIRVRLHREVESVFRVFVIRS